MGKLTMHDKSVVIDLVKLVWECTVLLLLALGFVIFIKGL